MKQRKVFISRKLADGRALNVEVLDVGQDDLVLLTVSITWPDEPLGRESVPWVSDDDEMYFFVSVPFRWVSSEVSNEMAQLQVNLFTKQLGHSD